MMDIIKEIQGKDVRRLERKLSSTFEKCLFLVKDLEIERVPNARH